MLKTSISGTNTSSQTFAPFTGASFVNDCLLQPMLHVNHQLLQFADIMHPLLSTGALFSRCHSHSIQTWTTKAASYLARLILRSYVQYASEIGSSCNFHEVAKQDTILRYDTIRYDAIYLHALQSWQNGQLNLAHGTETKNSGKTKNNNRLAQKKRCS